VHHADFPAKLYSKSDGRFDLGFCKIAVSVYWCFARMLTNVANYFSSKKYIFNFFHRNYCNDSVIFSRFAITANDHNLKHK
jgi:hypothetical protein